jgi:hypothetical protein
MKKRTHGPTLYYATDKNVFDALNQHKVDTPTVMKLFQRRNVIVGKKTSREDLAKYFSRLTHDYYDHKDIAARLGIVPRRERTTSMDVTGLPENESVSTAIDQMKKELESAGDVVHIARNGDSLIMTVQYSTIDYKRNEFSQVQVRDGTVEFVKSAEGFVVRNTQNEYLNDVRETLLAKIEKASDTSLTKLVVSLFDVPSAKLRSKFFHELIHNLPGYSLIDVTDVYIYKAKPENIDDGEYEAQIDVETHVERVFLRGNGITRSELLNGLLDNEDYYITKIGWAAAETKGIGKVYDIEALFADPKDCNGFSFILSGVFPIEEGILSSRRRAPQKDETEAISRVIEAKSRELVAALRMEFSNQVTGELE